MFKYVIMLLCICYTLKNILNDFIVLLNRFVYLDKMYFVIYFMCHL